MRRQRPSNTTFALLLTLAYGLIVGIVVSRHEIWRDEAQAFLMAKDSRSIPDLLHKIKNDVHPPLWHLTLYFLTRWTSSPLAMQITHLLIASAAVFLFARFSPFSRLNKVLFALGYYALFEYSVIARNYALGILFLFLFCVFYQQRNKRFLFLGIFLALLSLTSIHALILAVALTLALIADRLLGGRPASAAGPAGAFWPGIALSLAGIATSILSALPNPESIYAKNLSLAFHSRIILPVVRTIPKAFFALPDIQFHFWNKSLLNSLPATAVTIYLLAFLVVVFAVFLFIEHRPALIYYILATSALVAFFTLSYFGYIRHHSFFFFAFLSALWISWRQVANPLRQPRLRAAAVLCRKAAPAVLGLFLGCQAAAGLYAAAMDFRHPFSQGLAAAKYIQRNELQDRVLVGDIDYVMSPISAYLKRPIYCPRGERWATYQLNVHPLRTHTDMNHITAAAERLSRESGKDFLLILNYPLNDLSLSSRSLRLVGKSGDAIVEDEVFYLYRKGRRPSESR